MDSFGIDCIQNTWLQKPAQSGATDGMLGMILYSVLQDPGQTLLVEPTEDLSKEVSKERCDDMKDNCPKLKELFNEDSEESGLKKKTFLNMTVYFGWAGSPVSLASRAIRYLFLDEINKPGYHYTGKEGSPISLAKERTSTFRFTRKHFYTSTPTTEDGNVTIGEKGCEARFRYFVPCPHCGHRQQLIFSGVKFGPDHTPEVVEEGAWYECESCHEAIHEEARMEMVRRGEWRDIISGLDFDECIARKHPKSVGFQFSRLYVPWFSFGMVAAEFLRSKGDQGKLQNWHNSWMGEEFALKILATEEAIILKARVADLLPQTVPEVAVALTCGIDVQKYSFWFAVRAWTQTYTSWLIHYGELATWDAVENLIFSSRYPVAGHDGVAMPIWRVAIDTGGGGNEDGLSMTEETYWWIVENCLGRGVQIWGTKGASHPIPGLFKAGAELLKTPSGKSLPHWFRIILVDTDRMKDMYHYGLEQAVNGRPRAAYLHAGVDKIYAEHIMAEEKKRDPRTGAEEWVQIGNKPNHLLDADLLAMAVAHPDWMGGGVNLIRDRYERSPPAPLRPTKAGPTGRQTVARSRWMSR